MRRFLVSLGLLGALAAIGPPTAGAAASNAVRRLRAALQRDMGRIGGRSGAFVLDLSTGTTLFAENATVARLPASVQKLYTTTTVLERFGPDARLSTTVWGQGRLGRGGVWRGTLYLRGGGDPTFGSSSFDRSAYGGTGATVRTLVSNLLQSTPIRRLDGGIVADATYFDSRRSTAESNFRPDIYMTGELNALTFDRGFANFTGTRYQIHPALYAAGQLASALRTAGVRVNPQVSITSGTTPPDARLLGTVYSPRISRLLALTNTPSDNFLAEMLLKGLGARFGSGGTTAAGAAVVRSEMLHVFGIRPRFNDGSGLSYADSTTPRQVVTLLQAMAANQVFRHSLAIGGRTGTLQYEMRGTAAQGRCQGKTGTLHSVANLSGYCLARDGHTLAFAILANAVRNPDAVHSMEANGMAPVLAKYDG